MENILLFKILEKIKDKEDKNADKLYIEGYKYDPDVFNAALYLYEQNYIKARLEKDESDSIVDIMPTELTKQGLGYYIELKRLLGID